MGGKVSGGERQDQLGCTKPGEPGGSLRGDTSGNWMLGVDRHPGGELRLWLCLHEMGVTGSN